MSKVLIVGDGPVPAPEHKKVEGGGLRCWGLAKGLKQGHPDLDVTVSYNEFHKSKEGFTEEQDGIHIRTYRQDTVSDLVKGYDSVIVSYCMGGLTSDVMSATNPTQQMILDCYVPIYVEASARQTASLEEEYRQFNLDAMRWNEALRYGDLYLCASAEQKRFYQGALSALGRVNPVTYDEDPILVVPYGIYRDEAKQTEHPIQKMIGKDHASFKKILWFGGIYPWFDLTVLIDAIGKLNKKLLSKLVIVGAKNPFNTHPDFLRKYDELVAYIETHAKDYVLLQDWVKFDERANYYLDTDVVVLINNIGLENQLSWRTRLVDFIWANQTIITNGGDSVSEMLIQKGAAARFGPLDAESMSADLFNLLSSPTKMEDMKAELASFRDTLYWDGVTRELGNRIKSHYKPKDTKYLMAVEHLSEGPIPGRVTRLKNKVKRVPQYVKEHGVIATGKRISRVVARKIGLSSRAGPTREPGVVIIAHQLDLSGAPYVIMELAKELKELYPDLPLFFYTYQPAHRDNISILNQMGIKPKIIDNRDASITFSRGDVVILNSVAHRLALLNDIFKRLQTNFIKKLIWYSHEDHPESLFEADRAAQVRKLLATGKLEFRAGGTRTALNFKKFFGNEAQIQLQHYRLPFDEKYHRVLKPEEFSDQIRLVLPGTLNDGRKGQMPVFYAFAEFLDRYYKPNPEKYRDFELIYVGLGPDFLSSQIEAHEKALGGRLKTHGRLSHAKNWDVVYSANCTICYSLREALPLFVFEGMITGHPVLRNDSSGMEEQLIDGENGFYLDSNDFRQLVDTIERLMNREKTPDALLAEMSAKSYEMARKQALVSYKPLIESAYQAFVRN